MNKEKEEGQNGKKKGWRALTAEKQHKKPSEPPCKHSPLLPIHIFTLHQDFITIKKAHKQREREKKNGETKTLAYTKTLSFPWVFYFFKLPFCCKRKINKEVREEERRRERATTVSGYFNPIIIIHNVDILRFAPKGGRERERKIFRGSG